MTRQVITGARLFDGTRFRTGSALVIEDGRIVSIQPEATVAGGERLRLRGTIAPGREASPCS